MSETLESCLSDEFYLLSFFNQVKKFKNAVIIMALKKSENVPPIGIAIYDAGEGPYFLVIACIFAIALEVEPIA